MKASRFALIATTAIGLVACNDARDVVAPRALTPAADAAKAQIPIGNSLGDLSAIVTGPDALTAGETANYSVDLTSSNTSTPDLDVVIVMDASGSVTASGWSLEKSAVVNLINSVLPPSAHIGIVEFSDDAVVKYTFTQNQTRSAITSVVHNLSFMNSETATLAAVQSALGIFTAAERPNSARLMIMITDGTPNPPQTQNPCGTTTAAKNARNDLVANSIRTTIFGVGPQINSGALSCLIDNDPARFIPVANFSSLDQILGGSLSSFAGLQDVTYTATLPSNFTLAGPVVVDRGTATIDGNFLSWTVGQMIGGTAHLSISLTPNDGVCGLFVPVLTHQRAHFFVWQDTSFEIPDRAVRGLVCDTAPPAIAPTITGTAGANGWYTSDVTVHWTVTPGASGVSSASGCDDASVTQDTDGVSFTCTATSGAGIKGEQTVTIKRDAKAPVVSDAIVSGPIGSNGWYTGDVNVSWNTSYGVSGAGASTGCAATTLTSDTGAQTFTCHAVSGAGLSTTKSVTVKRDATKPAITFAAGGTYTVDQNISAVCSATDAISGVASSNCASFSGSAYNFNVGVNNVTATATDNAGNLNSAAGSFTVTLTTDGVTSLIARMVRGTGQKTLLNRMKNIEDKVSKHSPSLDSQIKNFLKELDRARADGDVSAADAAVLGRLAQLFQ